MTIDWDDLVIPLPTPGPDEIAALCPKPPPAIVPTRLEEYPLFIHGETVCIGLDSLRDWTGIMPIPMTRVLRRMNLTLYPHPETGRKRMISLADAFRFEAEFERVYVEYNIKRGAK